jgi:hypothetical protein
MCQIRIFNRFRIRNNYVHTSETLKKSEYERKWLVHTFYVWYT